MKKNSTFVQSIVALGLVLVGVEGLSLLSDRIYASAPPVKPAMIIDTSAPAAAAKPAQVADASAANPTDTQAAAGGPPDPKAGATVFGKCKSCHTISVDLKNGMGPGLYGVVGRNIAASAEFKYSDAMKAKAADTWTPEFLNTYLTDVKATVPGTKMAFAGIQNATDRVNLIAYLAQNSATPLAPDALNLAAAAPAAGASTAPAAAAAPAAPAIAQIPYTDPAEPTAEALAKDQVLGDELKKSVAGMDYQRARFYPLHFKPAIDTATNGQCLACHQEVLDAKVRDQSPAGVKASDAKAWYQTLATYDGEQMTFHQRHISSPYAKAVMNLNCTFCHQGNDPRDESTFNTVAPTDMAANNGHEPFTLRKMVNPTETCLRCHGAMPDPEKIMGLPGKWKDIRKDMETAEQPNGCLTCHAETARTNRHNVNYLNAATIEDLAKESSDVCYGCHGGRAWYRNSYAYPRHPWPTMDQSTVPDWAKDRKPESDPRYVNKQ